MTLGEDFYTFSLFCFILTDPYGNLCTNLTESHVPNIRNKVEK